VNKRLQGIGTCRPLVWKPGVAGCCSVRRGAVSEGGNRDRPARVIFYFDRDPATKGGDGCHWGGSQPPPDQPPLLSEGMNVSRPGFEPVPPQGGRKGSMDPLDAGGIGLGGLGQAWGPVGRGSMLRPAEGGTCHVRGLESSCLADGLS